jgi:DNA topoisomerase VI subunit B
MSEARLVRTVFKTDRALDFFGKRELTAQIGHEVEAWPVVALKELADNALDSCEEAGTAPVITVAVNTTRGEITVADNGPGIPAKVISDILDFSVRVSSREAYVSPTRGAQGNALKTLIAMPFALTEGEAQRVGETVIESRGTAHRLVFTGDPVRRTPKVSHDKAPSSVKTGTRVTLRWPQTACHALVTAHPRFLRMVQIFGMLNPHLALSLHWNEVLANEVPALDPGWEKWRPSDPTSPHWYDHGRLERLIAACVADDRDHKRSRSARDFVGEFRGLSGSAKAAAVLDEARIGRPALASFFVDDRVEHGAIARLLHAMQNNSRPVAPKQLGMIGRDHLAAHLLDEDADPANFRYRAVTGERNGVPFVVEAAFVSHDDDYGVRISAGVNWSPAITGWPFRFQWQTVGQILAGRTVYESSPVSIALHFVSPRLEFTDRGKSTLAIDYQTEAAFIEAIEYVTAHWARSEKAQERAEERERAASMRRMQAAVRPPKRPKNEIVGTGALHQKLAAAAEQSSYSITDLTVLSPKNDPYRLDNMIGHAAGKWFADQVENLVGSSGRVHLRGLFYRIVAAGGIARPDGATFTNTEANWRWLTETAAKAARWLGYVPFNRISDERNAAPFLYLSEGSPHSGNGGFEPGSRIEIPGLDPLLPRLAIITPRGKQPFRIMLFGEKSSLVEVLQPIAERVHGELILPTGESTEAMVADMVDRAAADGRPAVVLYFADFDPSGHQMSVSVARKLQAHHDLRYPELQIVLHRVALTRAQVDEFNLPSTPLKITEKRRRKWLDAFGHEQTEIDALAALRPDDLYQIAINAVQPFFDFTLAARCREAIDSWHKEAEAKIANHPARTAPHKRIATAHAKVKAAVATLHRIQGNAYRALRDQLGIANVEIPAPEAQIEVPAPTPLFTTSDDFVTASRKLIGEKKYEDEEETTGNDDA